MSDVQSILSRGLGALDLVVSNHQISLLARLADYLHSWSSRINLTGHRGPEQIARRLILDSAALYAALPGRPVDGCLGDLGSGAGFPGLPLAILAPQLRVILVDSRERRHHFQRAACRELEIQNAEPVRGRIEDLDPQPCDYVIAQALARPEQALEWMLPWAAPNGYLVVPGAELAPVIPDHSEISKPEILRYQVPDGGPKRTLWIARRS